MINDIFVIKNRALIFFRSVVLKPFFKAIQSNWKSQMWDIKRAIFAESEVKTKKKGFHFGNPHISAGLLIHFLLLLYGFMHISPFMDVYKKKPRNPIEFSGDPTLGRSP